MLRLLLNTEALALGIKLGYAITLRVVDPVAEDGSDTLVGKVDALFQEPTESCTVEDIIS